MRHKLGIIEAGIKENALKVVTRDFGSIDIDERQKIHFPDGLIGLPGFKDYALLDGVKPPYYYLQSLDSTGTAFYLIDPFLFRPDYEMDVSDEELAEIGINNPESAILFVLLTIPAGGSDMTANLKGPIIINRESREAKQVVLDSLLWKTKHNVLTELAESKKALC
jgi:flagellar assembly factor FliW